MTTAKLSVNINKFATIRNARGGNNPDLIQIVKDCESFGSQGITIHPRPDERHIRRNDVYTLKPIITTEYNIEGYPSNDFIDLVMEVRPEQVTLVPDSPEVLTSNAGWDCIKQASFLKPIIEKLQSNGIRTSIFLDPEIDQVKAAKQTGADRIELYTESYAIHYKRDKWNAINPYVKAAEQAHLENIGLNAGHDLSLENLAFFVKNCPHLLEVSIGHALVCDALYLGLHNAIVGYLNQLNPTY